MVQPNYSPQESLERVKLMMKYDTSKTLNENKGIIKEQDNTDADVGEIQRELDEFNSNEQKIVDIIKKYNNKSSFQNFLNKYKTITGKDFGEDVYRAIRPNTDPTEWNDLKTHLSSFGITLGKSVNSQSRGIATFQGLSDQKDTDNSKISGGTDNSGGSKYTSCPDTLPIKQFCKNETIKKVQACLRMPIKYQTGNFGPITQKALEGKGQDGTTITTETIVAVCGNSAAGTPAAGTPAAGTPATGTTPEVDGEIITIDGTKQDF
jgi:hypothetical protein